MNYIEKKVEKCLDIVKNGFEKMSNPFLSFSGGKDSTLILWLVRKIQPDIKVIFMDTCDHVPDIYSYVTDICEKWQLNFYQFEHDKHKMCSYEEYLSLSMTKLEKMAIKDPMNSVAREFGYDGCFWGIRKDESRGRDWLIKKYGSLFFSKTDELWRCSPIAHISMQELWLIIDEYEIPYSPQYDNNLIFKREQIRSMRWKSKKTLTKGSMIHLKKYYPAYFNKMRELINVTEYV